MQLSATEVRILGALVEKQATTPDVYPLSLNGLTTACNQTTNREPVMDLSEDNVKWAVNSLRQQSLVRAIQRADSRVMKYEHLLKDKLQIEGAELAVLGVMLLRGAQTLSEIKTRTVRSHDFTSLTDVQATIDALIRRELAVEVARRAGQKETRFTHLLGPLPDPSAASEATPAVVVAHEGAESGDERIRALETTIQQLRTELGALQNQFEEFKRQFS